jgi:hypothetical protein
MMKYYYYQVKDQVEEIAEQIAEQLKPMSIAIEVDPLARAEAANPENLRIGGQNILNGMFMTCPETKTMDPEFIQWILDATIRKMDQYPIMKSMLQYARSANRLRA